MSPLATSLDEVMKGYFVGMRTYMVAFFTAATVCALCTPLVLRLAMQLDAVSSIGSRHATQRRVPRLGGVGIAIALFAPLFGLFLVENAVADLFRREWQKVVGMALGAAAMCAVGARDDTKGVRALHKLLVQILCASLAYAVGFRIDAVQLPIFGELSMGVFGLPITIFWIVGITNAVNLIDGLDGLAAGVVFFAGVTNFVTAIIAGQVFSAMVMAAMLGALIAFLFYNFNPARIFMGDSGSYFLGYVMATTALVGASQKASTAVSLLVPMVALGVPIFDTLFAILRRFLEKRPLFSPDRGHIHHRLLDLGITHRRAVLILYSVSLIFTVASIAIYLGRSWQVGLALMTATLVLFGLVRFLGYFSQLHWRKRLQARIRGRDTELLRHALPSFVQRFQSIQTKDQLFLELESMAEEVELTELELFAANNEDPLLSYRRRDSDLRTIVAYMEYPLGNDALAKARIRFGVRDQNEQGNVSPQTEILLQVVVDLVTEKLTQMQSDLAPTPASRRGGSKAIPSSESESNLGSESAKAASP